MKKHKILPETSRRIPILMSGDMVRALAKNKRQTRRPAEFVWRNPDVNKIYSGFDPGFYHTGMERSGWVIRGRRGDMVWEDKTQPMHCKYGKTGDILWVRESVWQWGSWRQNGFRKDGKPKRKFVPYQQHVRYVADCPDYPKEAPDLGRIVHADELWVKRPSMFMPKWACRWELTVEKVGCARNGYITAEDAIAEGIEPVDDIAGTGRFGFWDYSDGSYFLTSTAAGYVDAAKMSFESLYDASYHPGAWKEPGWHFAIYFDPKLIK